jgi:hypothetical protein
MISVPFESRYAEYKFSIFKHCMVTPAVFNNRNNNAIFLFTGLSNTYNPHAASRKSIPAKISLRNPTFNNPPEVNKFIDVVLAFSMLISFVREVSAMAVAIIYEKYKAPAVLAVILFVIPYSFENLLFYKPDFNLFLFTTLTLLG